MRLLLSPATAGAKVKKQLYAWLVCQFSRSSLGHCSSCLGRCDEDLTLSLGLIVCVAVGLGSPPVVSARRTKITESWKAKCALSLTWQIWKEVNALYLGRLNWTPVSSHSGELRHEFWKIVCFQPNAGAGQTLSRFNWSTLTWVLLAFYSAHVLKIAALCCSENINMIYSGHD